MSSPRPPRLVPCPCCGRSVPWLPTSEFRPFCSARCKGIDLGAWASERYQLSDDTDPLADNPDPVSGDADD